MPAPKNIVVLGGSYAGVSAAHNVLKHAIPRLPRAESYRVVLVSAAAEALCRQACPRALISDDMFPQDKLFVSTPAAFERYPSESFHFIHGTAIDLDHHRRAVTIQLKSAGDETVETIDYHSLVIATGASTPSPLLGLNRDEQYLRRSWAEFRKHLATATSIVVAGGGPSGVETAGELGEYLNGAPGWFDSRSETPKVCITVVTSAPKILPALRDSIASKAEEFLANVGVRVIKNTRVVSVSPQGAGTSDIGAKATVMLDGEKTLHADLYIPAFGTAPNTSFVSNDLLATDGRVDTTSALRVEKAGPRVYALGDASTFARPAVHSLLSAVPILSANIKRDLLLDAGVTSKLPEERFFKEDTQEAQLVPIGKAKGVGAMMGFQLPGLVVRFVKGGDYWLWTTRDLWSGKKWKKKDGGIF